MFSAEPTAMEVTGVVVDVPAPPERRTTGLMPSHSVAHSMVAPPSESSSSRSSLADIDVDITGTAPAAAAAAAGSAPPSECIAGSALEFRNLKYTIALPKRARVAGGPTHKTLLDIPMRCEIRPGQICAIMGPSGAGKSTLLNVLAQRIPKSQIEGTILIGGRKVDKSTRRKLAYVKQQDFVFPELTVRETITTSAMLRLPTSIPVAEKTAKVERIIRDLGLTKCADSRVGSDAKRGISGGEKKRLSVGTELVNMTGHAMGLLIGAITPNFQVANMLASIILIFIILTGGFFASTLPVFLAWIQEVSFIRYGFELIEFIQFNGAVFECAPHELIAAVCPITTDKQALAAASIATLGVGHHIGIIVALAGTYLTLTYFAQLYYRPPG